MKQAICGVALIAMQAVGQVAPLTHGPGADTEAAWSPDGRLLVFQREHEGDADLVVLDLETGQERDLVAGPGDARYPCWSPDGRSVVYSFGHITSTAHQGIPDGYNLFSVPATGGEPKRLTSGQVRDYTPAFSPEGKEVYFATTRGLAGNDAALHAMTLATGELREFLRFGATNMGAVSPTVSPDGRTIAFAAMTGLRANWRVMLARRDDPGMRTALTELEMAAYAPRWSPDGSVLACTGYRVGDPGWGVYLIRMPDGALARLDTGPGNARSPAWCPDGRSLVFESNRDGAYRIYRLPVGNPVFAAPPPGLAQGPARPLVRMELAEIAADRLPDRSGRNHHAVVAESLPKTEDGAVQCGKGFARIEGHADFAFGRSPFYVEAEILVESNPKKLQMIVMGDYPEHRLGWQLYLDPQGCACFSSRDPSGQYVGARMATPLPSGKRVTLTGVRDARGDVSLLLRGEVTADAEASGATMAYGPPNQIRIGSQFHGGDRFQGKLYRVEIGTGIPAEKRKSMLALEEVLDR